jgi:hypothetical protein
MLQSMLLDHLHNPESSWSCGRFGAIAEFHRDVGEPATLGQSPVLSVTTARGGIRINDGLEIRPIAYETISKSKDRWGHGVALCLRREQSRMGGRTFVTELGPDHDALRPEDRTALLFDLGLGGTTAEICVRTADPAAIALLRAVCGKPLFDGGASLVMQLPTLSPHRVFVSRIGRIEVYQPIPAPDGKSPDGPHTHVIKHLLERGRAHAATVPIPAGWAAGMTLYPPHPLRMVPGQPTAFDSVRHAAFQALMENYGAPALIAGKQAALRNETVSTREEALGHRIALRQQQWLQNPIRVIQDDTHAH